MVRLLVKAMIDWLLDGAGAAARKMTGVCNERVCNDTQHNNTRKHVFKNATSWQKGRENPEKPT